MALQAASAKEKDLHSNALFSPLKMKHFLELLSYAMLALVQPVGTATYEHREHFTQSYKFSRVLLQTDF